MKTSSVEFISRSPNPLPMKSKHHRFVLLRRIFQPWQWKRRKKRNRFEQTSRTLQRKISMRSTKDQLVEKDVLMPVKHNVFLWNLPDVEEVPSHDGETILLWSPWKYRCGQRTVRMAVVACSQKQNTVFARRRIKVKAELKLKKAETLEKKLLDIREREKKNAREVGTIDANSACVEVGTISTKHLRRGVLLIITRTIITCEERNEREATLEKQKIELAKLQLAQLEKEIELQTAKNKALSLNPAAKVEEKQFETNIENMIKSIKTLSLPVPTRSENFNLFFQSNVNSFESLCDLLISDKLFETLNKETATHIGIREAEDWFRPVDLAKECDIYISSRSESLLCKKVIVTKTSSVEFISQSPTPSPMKSKHRRFGDALKIFQPWQWKRRKKRDRFEQTSEL
ncbi:phosphatase and actin regulator 2 [Trichonephila clavipes]|nr:phosphatase and actin regulator 2 [Trichonephila clavipes]